MNKKQRKKALFGSLSLKVKENGVMGLTNKFLTSEPKTKAIAATLKAMNLSKGNVLLVVPNGKNNLHMAARNIKNVNVVTSTSINAYEVLRHPAVVFAEDAVTELTNHFLKSDEK